MKTLTWIGLIALLLAGVSALALPPRGSGFKPSMRPYVIDNDTHIDANLIDMFVTNHGSFAWDLITGDPGLTYPKGTDKQAVFASGLWMGALIDGTIHTVVAEYSTEYQPGDMVDVGPNPNYNDPHYRVYKIDGSSGPGDADWDEWPWEEGAPVDEYGDPLLLGDQTLWCVYNDADPIEHSNDAGNSPPLGIEIQQTTFAYNRAGPLGEIVFLKFLVINKGENFLEDTYVALWSDPDLGGAGDDLVGCDTVLSVGYCYNATNNDQVYGTTPPCVGYDFFQGPIVASEGDTAMVSGEEYIDFRNLPMTAFNKYINGTDPHSATESYWYMEGLNAVEGEGGPYIHPITGDTTTFFGSGDPVTNTGWLDDNAADRRFMLVSGPFDLEPMSVAGEVQIGVNAQEVVAAIVMGQGTDRLNSITVMKQNDDAAQKVFDANFNIPNPPPQPSVYVQARDGYINLIWGTEADGDVQINEDLGQEFHFEGFNIYQGWSVAGPWQKIGTFDEVNEYTYTEIDTVTGDTTIIECECRDPGACAISPPPPSPVPGCIVPGDGDGSAGLPPVGCDYIGPDEVHEIIDGLPPGTTIELDPIHRDFINIDKQGQYYVTGKTLTLKELDRTLRAASVNNPGRVSVIIRADKRVVWNYVVAAMNACNKAKIRDYRVTTLEGGD